MASVCNRFFTRASISSFRTAFNTASRSEGVPLSSRSATSRRASTFVSRSRAELGCVQSLLPLHSAVAVARLNSCLSLNSRNCRSLSQGSLCRTSPGL